MILFCLTVLSAAPAAAPPAREWNGAGVIQQLNEAAQKFRTVTAKLTYTKVTVAVDDKSTQEGEIYFRKNGTILIDILRPEAKRLLFRGRRAEIFYPRMNQVQEYDLEKHRGLVEQFLLLGFGTSGDDLKKSYEIAVLGETTLEERIVLQLELTPKDPKIRNHVEKVHLWLDPESWAPLQQKFFEVGGDYMTARYTDIKLNRQIPRSKLRLNAPKTAERVKPRT